jgi:hypothetical protein
MTLAVVGELSLIQCPFGVTPTPLNVLPDRTVFAEIMLMGNITDMIPLINIMTFVECTSVANPEVEAATVAAEGVLTPMPCVPVIVDPWISEAITVMVTEGPALDQTSLIMCTWAGVIFVDEPGNFTVMVP